MANKTSDERAVRITTTRPEMAALLGDAAKNIGLIDFDPQTIEIFDQGDAGFEVVFRVDTTTGV